MLLPFFGSVWFSLGLLCVFPPLLLSPLACRTSSYQSLRPPSSSPPSPSSRCRSSRGEELKAAVGEWQSRHQLERVLTTGFLDGTHPIVDTYELKVGAGGGLGGGSWGGGFGGKCGGLGLPIPAQTKPNPGGVGAGDGEMGMGL